MQRLVQEEWLDELPPGDPLAAGSRRDLQRLNAIMRHASLIAHELRDLPHRPSVVLDLGAGDGRLMLQVARRLSRDWAGTRLQLIDKQPLGLGMLEGHYAELGWAVERVTADVLQYSGDVTRASGVTVIANLFLHHFSSADLTVLFGQIARRTGAMIAIEPERSLFAVTASRLVGLIGCNCVTRHDAPVSVRAGFRGHELSALWPAGVAWNLEEYRAGLFSHVFVARSPAERAVGS
jgi:hypothetical protein